ncbi:MAG: hypothetical protein U1F09_13205 [Steroidobacteraceae bacterium]
MSEDISIRITADASGVKTGTEATKRELRGVEAAGGAMATGLKGALAGITLAMAPVIAVMAAIRGIGAFIKIADEAVQADNRIARLSKSTKDVQPTISNAFTEIRNAVVKFALAVDSGTGLIGGIGRVMSEVAQVVAIFAKTLFSAGSESDKLGRNQGAIEFAQAVGKGLAWAGDVIAAFVRIAVDSFEGLWRWIKAIGNGYMAIGEAALAASHGEFSKAGEIMRTATAGAGAAIKSMAETGVNDFMRLGNAIMGNGAALAAYKEQLANGTRIDLSSPEKPKDDHNKALIREMDAYSDALDKQIAKLRERASVTQQMIGVEIDSVRNAALAKVDADEQAAKFALQNKQITNEQYLALEQQFEDRRYAIKQQALQNELLLNEASGDNPVAAARIKEQLLELERQYQMRKAEIQQQAQLAATGGGSLKGVFQSMQQSLTQALDGMLSRTTTFAQGMRNVWASLRQSVIGEVMRMLMVKVQAFAREKLLALAHISAEGAKAGAGAAASQASIPYVGPILAVAAMASVLGSVLGLGSGIKSAAGGFDIPSGLNPVTQLHAEEMVLPADIANPLRDSLSGGGGGQQPVELKGVSAGEFFIASRKELLAVLRSARREFAL